MRQTPHCAVHVHVDMPDGATAVRACNGMRKWVPLLQALARQLALLVRPRLGPGERAGVICTSFPRAGIPRLFADYEDYAADAQELQALGECPGSQPSLVGRAPASRARDAGGPRL